MKPRTHILVQRHDNYLPLLKPLVDLPGSRYHLVDWNDAESWDASRYIAEGLLPGQKPVESKNPGNMRRNDALLILANVTSANQIHSSPASAANAAAVHKSSLKIYDYLQALKGMSGFHADGPVRMLLWVNDSEKHAVLPRGIARRKKLSVQVDMMCQVDEIVSALGAPELPKQFARETYLDIESGMRVAKRMAQHGFEIPQERQDEIQQQVQHALLHPNILGKAASPTSIGWESSVHREWHEEHSRLKQGFEVGTFTKYIGGPPGLKNFSVRSTPKNPRKMTPEYETWKRLEVNFKIQQKNKGKVESFIQDEAKIDALYARILKEDLGEAKRKAQLEEVDRNVRQMKDRLETVALAIRDLFSVTSDNRKAFAQEPPLLMWDRRESEPIGAYEDEWYPPKHMALLDFQPRLSYQSSMTAAQEACVDPILGTLFAQGGSNILAGIDSLAPGAAKALVPHLSSLQDPKKGGKYDLRSFHPRMLTPAMVKEIVVAWEKWPFKPNLAVLMNSIRSVKDDKDRRYRHGGQPNPF